MKLCFMLYFLLQDPTRHRYCRTGG